MNKTPRRVNQGIKTIAKREYEAKQAAIAAENAAKVRAANNAFLSTLKAK